MIAIFNYIGEIEMTYKQACSMSHSGKCDADVAIGREIPAIKRQLKKIDPDELRLELRDYGAWDEYELQDHEANLDRILWIAACDIVEEKYHKESNK